MSTLDDPIADPPPAPPPAPGPSLPGLPELAGALRTPALLLAAGLAALGIAFSTEAASAWLIWTTSTAYSHCLFVLPIVLYLLWERRAEILAEPVVPLPLAGLLALPVGAAWLVAERLGIMEGRQLMAITMVEVLFLAVLGWRMALAASGGLRYLYFLVPFGAFITPMLQDWTTAFIAFGLDALAIPHTMDGYQIEIPEGRFFVAEACAGLRFLIASIAFGVLYAQLMYRGPVRRAAFIVASIVVPILANWLRALGIVVLGHLIGNAQAAAADHLIYGWVFFSAVTLLLIIAGMPFRQDFPDVPAPSPAPAPPPRRLVQSAGLAALLALIAPAIAAGFDRAARIPLPAPDLAWSMPPGCIPAKPTASTDPGLRTTLVSCSLGDLAASVQLFSPRSTWSAIGAARVGYTREVAAEDVTSDTVGMPSGTWRYTLATGKDIGSVITATMLWTAGAPATGGLGQRLALARASLFGGTSPAILLAVTLRSGNANLTADEERRARIFLETFLGAQSKLPAEMARLSRGK